jgi:hypothetical protein
MSAGRYSISTSNYSKSLRLRFLIHSGTHLIQALDLHLQLPFYQNATESGGDPMLVFESPLSASYFVSTPSGVIVGDCSVLVNT